MLLYCLLAIQYEVNALQAACVDVFSVLGQAWPWKDDFDNFRQHPLKLSILRDQTVQFLVRHLEEFKREDGFRESLSVLQGRTVADILLS